MKVRILSSALAKGKGSFGSLIPRRKRDGRISVNYGSIRGSSKGRTWGFGSHYAGSIPAPRTHGNVAQWESAALAPQRLRVRPPSFPPRGSAELLRHVVLTLADQSRMPVRALAIPGANSEKTGTRQKHPPRGYRPAGGRGVRIAETRVRISVAPLGRSHSRVLTRIAHSRALVQ